MGFLPPGLGESELMTAHVAANHDVIERVGSLVARAQPSADVAPNATVLIALAEGLNVLAKADVEHVTPEHRAGVFESWALHSALASTHV